MAQMKKDFQRVLNDDAEFKDAIAHPHVHIWPPISRLKCVTFFQGIVVEVHASWCGPCECIRPSLWQMGLQNENLRFATASFDKVQLLKEYQGRVKPMFLVFKDGKRIAAVDGVDLPAIRRSLAA
jgi:thiol-disulfide isomerase/thioredoxin